ncbi:hypothetical protein ACFQVD_40860 [Streptosporangium amethystogenes subsp. fukuiense]|uniref:Calcium-binding protein n=1 Tax=Streptosporangium amethystogenes subsp. fukuiense TaxID=698418 RepID=A0ABW2TEQ2_9ACTN
MLVTVSMTAGLPQTASARSQRDAETTALLAGVKRFAEVSRGFATLGRLGERLPLVGLVPGAEAGLGLETLFDQAMYDPIKDITSLSELEPEYTTPGPRAGRLLASTREEGGLKRLDLTLDVTRSVGDQPVSISSATPRVSFTTSKSVDVDLKLNAKLSFGYDQVTRSVYLIKDASGPALTVQAAGRLDSAAKATAAFGILGVDVLGDSALDIGSTLTFSAADPNGDGRLDLTGTGELAAEGAAAGLFRVSPAGSAAATFNLRAQPFAGAPVDGATATVKVNWPDIATGTPQVTVAQSDLDRLNRFQHLTPKDLLDGLAHLANAINAVQRSQWRKDAQSPLKGNLDLPFMRGSLADAVRVSEAIEKFVKDSVNGDTGEPTFTSIQSMLAALGAAKNLPGGAVVKVTEAGYDDSDKKIAFTIVVDRGVNATPEPLNPAGQTTSGGGTGVTYAARTLKHTGRKWEKDEFKGRTVTAGTSSGIVAGNSADTITLAGDWRTSVPAPGATYRIASSDPLIGQVTFGDTFKADAGITRANAAASTAQVMRGYHASATVVLDLSDPVTGQGCASRPDGQGKACPYRHTNPDGTSTVVSELPRAADRTLLRTGRDLFGAQLSVLTGVNVDAGVGYLGVRLTGNLSMGARNTGDLLRVTLKDQGDVRLTQLFERLAAKPDELLDVRVNAEARGRLAVGVPGASDFFGGTISGDVVMPDIGDPATVEFRGFDRLGEVGEFGFDPDNPRALFGTLIKSLGALAAYLDNVKGTGPVQDALAARLPLVGRSVSELVAAEETGGGSGVRYGNGGCRPDLGHLTDPSHTFTDAYVGRGVHIGSRLLRVAAVCGDDTLAFTEKFTGNLPETGTRYRLRPPLRDAIDRLTAAPPDTLQGLVDELNKALGGQVGINYLPGSPGELKITLNYDKKATSEEPLRFSFGDKSLVAASGSGTLDVGVDGGVQLGLVVPLKAAFDPAEDLRIDPTSNVWLGAQAELNGTVEGTIGPLPVALGKKDDDPLQVKLAYSVNLRYPGETEEPVKLADFFTGIDLSLNETSDSVQCAQDPQREQTDLALCAVLPTYLNGGPVTTDGKHAFVVRLPRVAPLSDMFDLTTELPDGIKRLEVPDFDFGTLPAGMELDWYNLGDGIERYLTLMESGLRFAAQDGKLPAVGDDLQQGADFIGAKRQEIKEALSKLPNQGRVPTGKDLRTWYTTYLAPKIGPGVQPVISCVTAQGPAEGETCDAVPGPQLTGIKFTIDIGVGELDPVKGCSGDCESVERRLDIGVPGLALRQGEGDGVQANLAWRLHATVGLDRQSGFFVNSEQDDRPNLGVGVNVKLPKEINAKLSILDVKLENRPTAAPELFAGAFIVGLKPVGRIGMAQLADPGDLVETTMSARANIDWKFTVQAGSPMLPGLYGGFRLDWDLTKGGTPDPDDLHISFNDVTLEAGDFFRTVLGPVVTQVKRLTEPVRPVIDQLYAPIPVLSDLSRAAGGTDVNLITIAEKFNTLGGGMDTEFLTKVVEVTRVLSSLPDCQGSIAIPIGSFQVLGGQALNTPNSPDVADSLITGERFATEDLFKALDDKARTCAKAGAKSGAKSGAKAKAAPSGPIDHAESAGFAFPVLENKGKAIFSLLMGKDVELVEYDSGPLRLGFNYSQSFGPVYAPPPIMVVISGSAGIEGRIKAGFDTYGIRKAIEERKVDIRVLDSLYLVTTDERGLPLPVITLRGELEAGAAVELFLIKAGINGGISLTIAMSWADPTNDGKFRFGEFVTVLLRNPQCLFNMDGKLKVYLKAWVEIGVSIFKKRFDWTIVEATLLDFAVRPDCGVEPPKLATASGNALVLHIGPMRGARGDDWADPGDDAEQWTVIQLPADDTQEAGFAVSALGFREEYRGDGFDRVLADGRGATGDLRLLFQGYAGSDGKPYPFDKKVVAFGGAANDVVMTGTGASVVDGGAGDDQITTGDQYGGARAFVAGGPGNDHLTVGGAGDWVAGDGGLVPGKRRVGGVEVADWDGDDTPEEPQDRADDGDDRITAGLGGNHLWGNGGADTISVGSDSPLAAGDPSPRYRAQPNTLVGGPGGDTLTGGSNDDEIYTGPRQVTGPEDEGPEDSGVNYVDTGAGDDKVYGGRGVDLVAGRSQPGQVSRIFGGGGEDVLAGGYGKDEIFGGPGDDWVIAEPSEVGEVTGTEPYGPVRAVNHLPLPEGVVASAKLLVGGYGDDHLVGGDGGATVFGDRRRAEPCEEAEDAKDGRDLILGGAGREVVSAGGGDDRVVAGGGDDRVCGERGDDELYGGAGDDVVEGGSGKDTGYGDDGVDQVSGGGGDDTLYGGAQADTVEGNDGEDTLFGGAGDDLVVGGDRLAGKDDGADTLYGDTGADRLVGDNGTATGSHDLDGTPATAGAGDVIHGGDGDDTAFGGIGDDEIHGNDGADHLEGGNGADTVYGEAGEDEIVGGGTGAHPDKGDTLFGGDGPDVIAGDNAVLATTGEATPVARRPGQQRAHRVQVLGGGSGADVVDGGAGDDALFGQEGTDRLRGGEGDDYAEGGQDTDWVEGDQGDDDLVGGSFTGAADQADALYGGPGDDVVLGDNAEILRVAGAEKPTRATVRIGSRGTPMTARAVRSLGGAAGADRISGGTGVDVLWGQDGDDFLSGGGDGDYVEGGGGADVLRGDLPLSANSAQTTVTPLPDPGWPGTAGGAQDLEGTDPQAGQDDLIGGSSVPGAPDGDDAIEGGGADDVLLGDNGSLVRTLTGTAERVYTERYPAGQVPANATRGRTHDPDLPGSATRFCTEAQRTCEPAGAFGADRMYGDDGDDGLWGQDGDDRIFGGAGNDDLFGELGDDEMDGGAGEDAMLGDRGGVVNERVDAGDARRLSFTVSLKSPPKESYTGFREGTYDRRADLLHDADGDVWVGAPTDPAMPHDGLTSGGDDTMRGGPGRDSLHAGYGDDLANGDSGGDEVFGGGGADVLWGGKGCDPVLDAATPDCLSSDGTFDPGARGTGDRMVDHVFGGAGGTEPAVLGSDLLDYNPRGSYPGNCAPGRWPADTPTTSVDPCLWFKLTDKADAQGGDDQHHQGVDWLYGGAGRDVLQGDITANGPNPGDRMIDWNGSYNLFSHCGAANGGHNIVRQHSPAMQDFLAKVAWGSGAGRTAADATTPGTSAYVELAIPANDSGSAYPSTPGHFDSPWACAS